MSTRVKLIGIIVAAAVALSAWRFMFRPAEAPSTAPSASVAERAAAVPPPNAQPKPAAPAAVPPAQVQPIPAPGSPAESALNERTLTGTTWGREGFDFEFAADGRLRIGGRERAQWQVVGSRIRLYRDTTGEEHWLDIVSNKLMWEGQELGRVPQ